MCNSVVGGQIDSVNKMLAAIAMEQLEGWERNKR